MPLNGRQGLMYARLAKNDLELPDFFCLYFQSGKLQV